MLKGSATIELTNADGSKSVVKHDNMITNAPRDLLRSIRGELPPVFKLAGNNARYVTTMFGGVLLFDDTLNTDADDYFIPSVKITGYAAQNAYSGIDVARGSYNIAESGVQKNGSYRLVWDFSTSQANGTIKSLALCPSLMGYIGATETADSGIGYADSLNRYAGSVPSPFNSNGYMLDSGGSTNGLSNYGYIPVAVHDGILYAISLYDDISNNGGILHLYRFGIAYDSVSIKDRVGMARYIDTVDVSLPAEFVSTFPGNVNTFARLSYERATGKIIMSRDSSRFSIAVGTKEKFVEIDLTDMSVKLLEFTNNTSVDITAKPFNPYRVYKDYIIAQGVSNGVRKLYTISRTDNTIVKEVRFSDSHAFSFNSNYELHCMFTSGKILVFKTHDDSHSKSRWYILDMESGIVKWTNFTNYGDASGRTCCNIVDFGNTACWADTDTYLTFKTIVNPFILTTKNNLDSPVTKTASQTMKITYTLSEDTEVQA